jgi:ribosome-binding protein aMBF1 (putative translation factor)
MLRDNIFARFYPPEPSNFPEALRYYRIQQGMSLRLLGIKLDISKECVRKYEAGIIFPRTLGSYDFQKALGLREDVFAKYWAIAEGVQSL